MDPDQNADNLDLGNPNNESGSRDPKHADRMQIRIGDPDSHASTAF